jgi:hypothetical protein
VLVTWDPRDGSEPQAWPFDPDEVEYLDAKKIEQHFGGSWEQWVAQLQMGSIQARAVLLWYILYQVHPKLQFKDLPKFRVAQLKVEMGSVELQKLWKRVSRMKSLTDEERAAFEAQFETDMHDALVREGKDPNQVHVEVVDGQLAIEGAETELPKPA